MSTLHLPLKAYPAELQPRERLQKDGPQGLSDVDLLALLLSTGTQGQTALDLAQSLLLQAEPASLRGLAALELPQLCKLNGLGLAKAARLMAAFEIGKRVSVSDLPDRPLLNQPGAVAAMLLPRLRDAREEHLVALCLDTRHRLIAQKTVSSGILNGTLAHPRELFKTAIMHHAHAMIVAHNHPSGDPSPSPEDISLTQRLIAAGELLQIELLDHIILGNNNYTSLRETHSRLWRQQPCLL
jgi:DNA repair protein RadC